MDAILGFEPIGIIAGICRKPHYIWGYSKEGVKVCKKLPTIPDAVYPDSFGMSVDDKLRVFETHEEVMADFEREGFKMPEEDVWDFPRSIRIFMIDTDLLNLFNDFPEMTALINTVKDFTIQRNGGRWIYLTELLAEHILLLQKYNSFIYEEKQDDKNQ